MSLELKRWQCAFQASHHKKQCDCCAFGRHNRSRGCLTMQRRRRSTVRQAHPKHRQMPLCGGRPVVQANKVIHACAANPPQHFANRLPPPIACNDFHCSWPHFKADQSKLHSDKPSEEAGSRNWGSMASILPEKICSNYVRGSTAMCTSNSVQKAAMIKHNRHWFLCRFLDKQL